MLKHKSIAAAEFRGATRIAMDTHDELFLQKCALFQQGKHKSIKGAKAIYQLEKDGYGQFLISEKIFKRPSSPHFRAELVAIEPELIHTPGIGKICRLLVRNFDSRKFIKGDQSTNRLLTSSFYFDEHFFIRTIQRFGIENVGKIGQQVYPIIEWLINENKLIRDIPQFSYFVFKDFVVITHNLESDKGFVFKTVILKSLMTKSQMSHYQKAFEHLAESQSTACLMLDEFAKIIEEIPIEQGVQLIKNNCNDVKNHWLECILKQEDIRFNER